MKVDINEVMRIQSRRREINSVPLADIEWTDGDKPVQIDPAIIQEFAFTGLSNVDFIDTGICLKRSLSFKEDSRHG